MPDDTATVDASQDAKDDTQQDTKDDDDQALGDAGTKALEAFKARARDAERAAKAAQRELDALKKQSMSDAEKAVAQAREEGKQEALSAANVRLLKAELRVAAAGKLADPNDAVKFLDLEEFKVDDDGDVDSRALAKAVDQLVKEKPYLAATTAGSGSGDGGARGRSKGTDMNQLIRDRMRSR